jgi:transposase
LAGRQFFGGLAAGFSKIGVTRVGIEASGGYERGVIGHLQEHGFAVLLLQPMQVKAFARAQLRRAKNDALDAALIAAYAAFVDQQKRARQMHG